MDAILFAAGRRKFAPGPDRDAFHERWLGRYLQGGSDAVLVALHGDNTVAGYLVGALDDPSRQPRFADIAYLRHDFRQLCRTYPAHLHVNLAPAYRGQGLGARLITEFAGCASRAGACGMHVVTGKDARNARFYARCGFAEVGSSIWNDREILFLGKALVPATGRAVN
jgi:GNAT superfamily N-acetyltransferase